MRTTTIDTVTNAQIQSLADEAAQAGDLLQIRLCAIALSGGELITERDEQTGEVVEDAAGVTTLARYPAADIDAAIAACVEAISSAEALEPCPLPHVYSFDLSNFEDGAFAATRFPAGAAVSGDWVCVARDDAHALELARRAAADEWSAPTSREHGDFTVAFEDSHPPSDA